MIGFLRRALGALVVFALGATNLVMAADDLHHLTYTAVAPLHAAFLAPAQDAAEPNLATQVITSTGNGGGVELAVDGAVVSADLLGKRTVDEKSGETQYVFYGVSLKPGPNRLTLVPLGANGLRGTGIDETVYGPDVPLSVRASIPTRVVADGKTSAGLQIRVTDRYGHPAQPGARITLRILAGDARFAAAPEGGANEHTLPAGGYLEVAIVPGTTPGMLDVEVVAGNARTVGHYYMYPSLREPFVSGLVSLGLGALANPIDGDGTYDAGASKKARAAVYASGRVGKNSLLTLAYESQNRLTPLSSVGAFIDDPNQRPYLTYGDTSTIASPLASNSRLYARLDQGPNSLMWGLFNADVGAGEAGMYHQLLNGAKLDLTLGTSGQLNFTAFAARNSVAYASETIPVVGLGALLHPLFPDIVVGSDYIRLIALDRSSGLQVSQTLLIRNVDYTIDYASGILRFINTPLPYDARFDPQVLLVQYQYAGGGAEARTLGAGATYRLSGDGGTIFQVGYLNDVTGSQNYDLVSQEVSRTWATGGLSLSHAHSTGGIPSFGTVSASGGAGDAITFSLNNRTARDEFRFDFADTSTGFSNPFGGLSTAGILSYHAAYQLHVAQRYALTLSADGQQNTGSNASGQSDLTGTVQWHASPRLTLLLGLAKHIQHIDGAQPAPLPSPSQVQLISQTQLLAQAGVEYQISKRLAFSLQSSQTLSGSDVGSSQPSQTLAQLGYTLPGGGSAYLRELWSDQPTSTFADGTSALTTGSGSTHALQIGVARPLSPATTLSTDYVISGTGGDQSIYSTLGLQEKLQIGKRLSGNFDIQVASAAGPGAAGFTVWGGTLAYAAPKGRATISYQTRSGTSSGSTLALDAAGQISPNVSLVASVQRAYSGLTTNIDDKITLAYRPVLDDRFISLVAYERSNGLNAAGTAGNVLSFEQLYRPTPRLELAGRYAYKVAGDGYYAAGTSLWAVRARQQLTARFDIGVEGRVASVATIDGTRATDFVIESGYKMGSGTRLALGYDISGSVDPTLAGRPQRRGFYITLTTLVDRIFGWGKP